MFKRSVFEIGKNKFTGLKVKLQHANLVLITAKKGYIMCGYLNLKAANRLNEAACIVTGVSKPQDMFLKKIECVSSKARFLGVKKGMSVREALIRLS